MIDFLLEKFPVRCELRDGSPCSIRPLEATDEAALKEFHHVIPEREQLFVRNKILDGSLFQEWIADDSFESNLPLLAFVDAKIAGLGVLAQRQGGWKRHIGKVAFLTHPDYCGQGIIDEMMKLLVDFGAHYGMTRLESELNGERKSAIKSMAAAGFQELVRIPEYIQDMNAQYHDYVLMGIELIPDFENLGAGD